MQPITIMPQGPISHVVIWLHGLGADGGDMAGLLPELKLDDLNIKWIFPHAPVRPITLNHGMPMRGWYDIVTLDRDNFVDDEQGINESVALIHEMIDAEVKGGIASGNIVLAGFSQGGAIALHAALRYPQAISHTLALSTYLPMAAALAQHMRHATSVSMMHGEFDDIIPLEAAQRSRDQLINLGCQVAWHQYPMAHTLCAQQIQHIGDWFRSFAKIVNTVDSSNY